MQAPWRSGAVADLWVRARAGNADAFASLVGGQRLGLVRLARAVVGDFHEAEDVVQEALLRAFVRLAQVREPAAFGEWLRQVVLNRARSRLRALAARRAREELTGDAAAWEALTRHLVAGDAGDPAAAAQRRGTIDEVRSALAALPPRQREALAAMAAGRTVTEIATSWSVGTGAVRMAVHRGRVALAARFPEDALLPPSRRGQHPMSDAPIRFAGHRPLTRLVAAYARRRPAATSAVVDMTEPWDLCVSDLWWRMAELDRSALRPIPATRLAPTSPHSLSAFTADGEVWGVPLVEHPVALFFHPAAFAEHGIAPPSPEWTWDDVLGSLQAFGRRGARALTAGGATALALCALAQSGPDPDSIARALELAKQAGAGPWVCPAAPGEWPSEPFFEGRAAMTVSTLGSLV